MHSTSRFVGGILLIVGTSIGGGMLALPVANAAVGFWGSTFFLLGAWLLMTLGAFFILEVNLYLSPGAHMVSMAAKTLKIPGLTLTWITYLLLLYSLLCAYISGGADVLSGLLQHTSFHPNNTILTIAFTVVFSIIVYQGIHSVDFVNRGLMFIKLGIYALLVFLLTPYVDIHAWVGGDIPAITHSIMILITSFGFAIIVPNLRDYFNDDIPTLKRVIFIGSLIPLLCYIAWDAVIIGTLPAQDGFSLTALFNSSHTTSELAQHLSSRTQGTYIPLLFNTFTSVCMLTAFLGVSLCLISFLADGLRLSTQGKEGFSLYLLTFLPPLLLVIYSPGAYIHALRYAGFFCVILLLLLPACMSLLGRKKYASRFIVPGGYVAQWLLIIGSLLLLSIAL